VSTLMYRTAAAHNPQMQPCLRTCSGLLHRPTPAPLFSALGQIGNQPWKLPSLQTDIKTSAAKSHDECQSCLPSVVTAARHLLQFSAIPTFTPVCEPT
jgi:hypothetical protein